MKVDNINHTCNCELEKYSLLISYYWKSNTSLRDEIVKLQLQILELKKQINENN